MTVVNSDLCLMDAPQSVSSIIRKLWIQSGKDRFGVTLWRLSSDMAEGQMQLATEKSDGRKHRDEWTNQWLAKNLDYNVQDSESLALGCRSMEHGALNRYAAMTNAATGYDDIRVGRLFEACGDRGSSKSDDEWRMHRGHSSICVLCGIPGKCLAMEGLARCGK